MNSQNAFRKFAQQLQRASQSGGGGGMPGGSGRFLAGGGLMVALVGGGLFLNASLFNGVSCVTDFITTSYKQIHIVDGGHRAIKYTRWAFVLRGFQVYSSFLLQSPGCQG
jgi:prohibitin 2